MSARPTPEQLAEFDRDGFLVVRGFFEAAECAQLLRWTEDIAAAPELPGRHMVYYEDSLSEPGLRIVQRIENVSPFHAGFDTLMRRG
jgi:2-aminoethylphosphonate dioxygenase